MTREYAVVYEWTGHNYSAYAPDLPGCVTTGATLEQARRNMREAIEGHLSVMREFGEPIPEPMARVEPLSVAI